MITEGIVNELGKTEKGTPKFKLDGQWYFAGRGVQLEGLATGQKIGVEYTLFGKDNNLRSIKSWALLPHQPSATAAPAKANPAVSDDAELRFISNVVGQAIAAKTISSPAEIRPWFLAAKAAVQSKGTEDDDIPY